MSGKPKLTKEHELIILQACAEGYTDEQIAKRLKISDRTIRRICVKMMGKSRTKNRIHLVAWAVSNKLIKPRFEIMN